MDFKCNNGPFRGERGKRLRFGALPDLGPLPISDDNAKLQRESIKALNALLKGQDDILFRDERVEDYGVDGSFELKLRGGMTNFRGQVQMKAPDHVMPLIDGSISLSVRTANLNYLLNGTAPVYILYDSPKDEFWYVWAQDESRRLETENPAWRSQDWITLKFTNRFSEEIFESVYKRIMAEGRLHRNLHDSLARSTGREPIVISIDSNSLSITDPVQAIDSSACEWDSDSGGRIPSKCPRPHAPYRLRDPGDGSHPTDSGICRIHYWRPLCGDRSPSPRACTK